MRLLRFLAFLALASTLAAAPRRATAEEPIDAKLAKSDPNDPKKSDNPKKNVIPIVWYDVQLLGVEGQGWHGKDLGAPYDRLPAKAQKLVRDQVWGLSRHSAGLCVRFVTDSETVSARWTLLNKNLAMPHMPATGVSGVDLYVRTDQGWHWAASGQPTAASNSASLIGLGHGKREYLLYLPLYNGVTSIEIGIAKSAKLWKAEPYPAELNKPLVVYGTSITQGGCAARPGMVHTAILQRRLNRPVINLGFSGNGRMEVELANLLGEIDAAAYVIECLPNLQAKQTAERAEPFVKALRKLRPDTPILLIEDRTFTNASLLPKVQETHAANRAALRAAYEKLVKAGVPNLLYLRGDNLLGKDGEDTVDGSHPTDLGFLRYADAVEPSIKQLLKTH